MRERTKLEVGRSSGEPSLSLSSLGSLGQECLAGTCTPTCDKEQVHCELRWAWEKGFVDPDSPLKSPKT